MAGKVPGYSSAYGYWGRSPHCRVRQEQVEGRIRALLQDKIIAQGVPVYLYEPVTSGIQCSCRKETNQANDRPCPECYGTGFVPGYTRFLTETLFFTATQVSSLVLLPGSLTANTWTSSTVIPNPEAYTGGPLQTLSAPALANIATVSGPDVSASAPLNQLLAFPWSSSTAISVPTVPSFSAAAPLIVNPTQVLSPALTTLGASIDGLELDMQFKPNYLRLAAGRTSGTLTTGAIPFSNPNGEPWSARADFYLRGAGQSVTVEYSVNGAAFTALNTLNGAGPSGEGVMRFRITMTRAAATDRSPAWSAVRARHVASERVRTAGYTNVREDISPSDGYILVLRPWIVEATQSDTGRGVTVEWMGDRSWTLPLDFFDSTITADTPTARVDDQAPGPHPFFEWARGIKAGNRTVLTSFKYNEFGLFTQQSFDERRALTNEAPYADVF